jgi:hypothetical protein
LHDGRDIDLRRRPTRHHAPQCEHSVFAFASQIDVSQLIRSVPMAPVSWRVDCRNFRNRNGLRVKRVFKWRGNTNSVLSRSFMVQPAVACSATAIDRGRSSSCPFR